AARGRPPLAGVAAGDRAPARQLRPDRLRHARLRPLGTAALHDGAHRDLPRRRLRVVPRRARPRAPSCRRQLDGRRDRARARPSPGGCLGHRVLAGGVLDAARAALLRALAAGPRAYPGAAAPRTRAGRIALFSQNFGYPARLPAEEAVATLEDAWASPVLAETLSAFDSYSFQRPEQLR